MKKSILFFSAFFITGLLWAQPTSETVSLGAGYANQVWYSLENGEVKSQPKSDWDIAFEIQGFSASVLINSPSGVRLWLYPGSKSDFSNLDTTGMASWRELFNSDTSWALGAFNKNAAGLSLGWGSYDPVSHAVTGDSIYLIQLANGEYRKLEIQDLTSGTYHFRQASLDNSLEKSHSLSKSQFGGRNFGYFSLENETSIDREPFNGSWDLVFTQYTAYLFIPNPVPYTVSGVLSNLNTEVAKAYPVDPSSFSDYASQTFGNYKNGIGYDWKSFAGTWNIEDSLVYFVRTLEGDIWKVVFTGFGGSSDGNYQFDKEQLYISGLADERDLFVEIYPNPASDRINLVLENSEALIRLRDQNGKTVISKDIAAAGLQVHNINVSDLPKGVYFLSIRSAEKEAFRKVVIR